MNKKITAAVVALALAAGAILYVTSQSRKPQHQAVVAMNLALSGPVAAASGEYPLAFEMGLDEQSKKLGLNNIPITVKKADNKGTPRDAMTAFQQQDASGFDAYISGLSYASVPIAPELKGRPLPHFAIAFVPFITEKFDNMFRLLPSYRNQGPKYVDYAKKRNAKKVFMLTSNNSFVEEQFISFVEPGLREAGITFSREKFDISLTDYRTLALKAQQSSPDLIIIDCLSFQMLPLIQSLREIGLAGDGGILCSMDFIFLLYGPTIPNAIQSVVAVSPPFEIPGRVAGADVWRTRYLAQGGKEPNFIQAYAYDTAGVLLQTFHQKGNLKPDSIRSVFPYVGVTGELDLDEHRDLVVDLGFITIDAKGERKEFKP